MEFEAIILDTETTDTDKPDVIELAWRSAHLAADARFTGDHTRFKPTKPISLGALATHHILADDLEGCASSAQAHRFVPSAQYWIGHKIDFDWDALGQPPVKRICTLAMCRSIWPKVDSHNLTAMTYYLEGMLPEVREKVKDAHGAVVDIALCAAILRRIVDDEGISTFFDLHAFSEDCRIPKIMSFGKYKGRPIGEVDRGWSNWYLRQEETDPYLITALRRARKI